MFPMELHRGGRRELRDGFLEEEANEWALKDEQHLADEKGIVAKKQ